jgi:hypothetical protein
MNAQELKLPAKGFTKTERAWLSELIEAIRTVHAVEGRNTTIDNTNDGQVVNADDCTPCP